MKQAANKGRAYKEVTLQQLRSFHETARLGSLSAAAASLGLAQPTVWAQVHALERHFAVKLVESHGRGCQLTNAGRILVELISPSVAGIAGLKRNFQEALAGLPTRLVVATTSRILVEDMPGVAAEFSRRVPQVRLAFQDMTIEQVIHAVESGNADVGLTVPWPQSPSPWLVFDPAYDLEVLLLTPRDHPLAKRRRITPDDLRGYPLVNAPDAFKDRAVAAALEKLGLFEVASRCVEVAYVPAIRRCVELGLGIGIVSGRLADGTRDRPYGSHLDLHERSMSQYFGRVTIYLVWRRKPLEHEAAAVFAEIVRARFAQAKPVRPTNTARDPEPEA